MNSSGNKFKNKKVLVIGLGKSGISVIKQIITFVDSIIAIDNNPGINIGPCIKKVSAPNDSKLKVILDSRVNDRVDLLKSTDLVIVSPGVCSDVPLVKSADCMNIPIWSEIEVGWQLLTDIEKEKTIAVTGTNGKTTVVTLLQRVISASGMDAIACGNIGNPLTSTLDKKVPDGLIRVIEVSSFQLERVSEFNPRIGIILNITDDHMDRHYSINEYADIKFKLFSNASTGKWAIFNIDDRNILNRLNKSQKYFYGKMNIVRYSLDRKSNSETYFDNNRIFYSICGKNGSIDLSNIHLLGKHNISNIMSVVSASRILDIDDRVIEKTIGGFKTLEHRLEYVCDLYGVKIFNDSKATNPDATIKALESFDKKTTLILGGMDKDMDFSCLITVLSKRVVNVILIGQTRKKMLNEIELLKKTKNKISFEVIECGSLREAVIKGLSVAKKDEILLLSPACASFDMFDDYKDRGRKFKKYVQDIKNGKE